MTYPASTPGAGSARVRPDSGRFWAGAVATAIVAALIALVGILICRWTLKIPILAPAGDGAWGDAHTGEYVLVAALVALVAAGLLYLLMLSAPNPDLFFRWIIGLVTLIAVVYPFSSSAPLEQKAATAIVNLILGLAIGSLLTATAARAVRIKRTVPPPQPNPYDQNGPVDQARPAPPVTRVDPGAPADPYGRRGQGYGQQPTRPTYTPRSGPADGWE